MRILLLGATGQVGWELERTLSVLGELMTSSRSGNSGLHLDISDLPQLRATLDTVAPDVIVNATAYTAVDKAESEPERAMRLNGEVPAEIGAWAAAHDALAVHYSTDYVFDGDKDGPYVETDPTNPVSVYGRTKLTGDQALLASGCATIILRVSWVYGLRGQNFLLTMRRLMKQRGALRIVNDQFGAPTWCRSIAQATASVLSMVPGDLASRRDLSGVYHL
ncbi:MAG: dTDP-4-dehydrorhamnose reductase, partial [Sedimenticolaceae bacterium]